MGLSWTDDLPGDTVAIRVPRRPPRRQHRPRFLQVFLGYPGRHARKAARAWT